MFKVSFLVHLHWKFFFLMNMNESIVIPPSPHEVSNHYPHFINGELRHREMLHGKSVAELRTEHRSPESPFSALTTTSSLLSSILEYFSKDSVCCF